MQRGLRRYTAQQAAHRAARSHVDRMDTQHGMSPICVFILVLRGVDLQVNIIHADYFSPIDVDNLLVKQIALQQEQTFGPVDGGPLRHHGRGAYAAIDRRNCGERQDAVAGFSLDDQGRYPGTVLLGSERHLAHTPAGRARRVIHRGAQQFSKGKSRHLARA